MDARDVNLTLDFCLRVGELLLSSGAGAADVAASMRSLSRHLGLRNAEIDVTYINLSMQYQPDPEEMPVLVTRQVQIRAIDYDHLTQVDHLIRDVIRGALDLKEARAELARIVSGGHGRPRWAVTLGVAAMAAAVAVQLGGGVLVSLLASVSAVGIDRLQLGLMRRRLPIFYQQVAGAGLASLLALGAAASPVDIDVSSSITANIVVLLAGIGFMGALQDALTGFHITASARLMEALMSTAGIIAGVSGGLALASAVGVTIPPITPGATDVQGTSLSVAGAAIAAGAFAYASYAPRRIIAPIALIAAVAMGIFLALPTDLGRALGVGVAAFFVGLVSYSVSGRLRVPPLVVVVSAVVPLLPGLSIYRGLTLLSEGTGPDTSDGLLAMFTAASIAVALSSGVFLGEYVAQPLKRPARKLEARLAGPRLVGPVRTPRTRKRGRKARSEPA
ncbi:threonine/serine exporter ThrE family protein [Nocardioides sp. DS6]|uniref:Threonine/serine exporter ThrE family protein n=1 Tax=Nocardioides eburneus TaxID=3231482 RepID=A0ABV3T1G3_9ACTN